MTKRSKTTEDQWRERVRSHHLPTMKAALRTLELSLSDDDVCSCDVGNDAGITERECACEHREAAKTLEAGGCYVRRGLAKGWTL